MKIVSLVGSYRTKGNTNGIVSMIEEGLAAAAQREGIHLEIERIQLGHLDLKMCRGCRVCFDKGEEMCPLRDELLAVRDSISHADGILAASPVYVEDVTGIMKNWIDRMAYNCHRPAFAGKSAYVVTTSGAGSTNHSMNTIKNAFTTWGISVAGQKKFRTGGLMDRTEMKSRYACECEKAAGILLNAVKFRSSEKPSIYSLMVFKIQQMNWQKPGRPQDTIDYAYWQKNGWLEKNCSYFIPNRANIFKIKFAGLMGRIIAGFLT